jgi:hypothetical protein
MAGGVTAPHPGQVFSRKDPLQMHVVKIAPAAVDVKGLAADVSLALNTLRASKVNEISMKRTEKIELSWAKRKLLHTVACSVGERRPYWLSRFWPGPCLQVREEEGGQQEQRGWRGRGVRRS